MKKKKCELKKKVAKKKDGLYEVKGGQNGGKKMGNGKKALIFFFSF